MCVHKVINFFSDIEYKNNYWTFFTIANRGATCIKRVYTYVSEKDAIQDRNYMRGLADKPGIQRFRPDVYVGEFQMGRVR